MIIQRKKQLIRTKSKDKLKVTNPNDNKKPKKNTNTKLVGSASVRVFKMAHQDKYLNDDNIGVDQNKNVLNFIKNESDEVKKQYDQSRGNTQDQQKNNGIRRMRKSASTGGMKVCKTTRRSLSPALNKQKPETLRVKYSSKQTSRSDKDKGKQKNHTDGKTKSTQKLKCTILAKYGDQEKKNKSKSIVNKSTKTTRHQSQHLKTQQSSKMPSVSKEMDMKKPKKKTKGKQKGKQTAKPSISKSKIKVSKMREKLKNSIIFSDVSFQQATPLYSAIATKQNFYLKVEQYESHNSQQLVKKIEACIMIQKHFRGYLTRKYINELKYMVCCIIRIQKVWRGYICRKKLKRQVNPRKKNLSIENSLVTIKDFSEEPKEDRMKDKHFFFDFGEMSSNKKLLHNEKSGMKELCYKKKQGNEKYISLLESLLQDEELQEKIKDRIRISLGKQAIQEQPKQQIKQEYVKNKINSQIVSQKSFNSPREVRSPRSNAAMNSPSSWAKNKSFECSIELCTSPVNQKLVKRMISPSNKRSPISSLKKQKHLRVGSEIKQLDIKPFDTSFEFLQEFQMKIIDYMKENNSQLEDFLERCQNTQYFKTNLVLKEWDKFSEDPKFMNDLTPQFSLTENIVFPVIFPTGLKNQVLRQPQMQMYLQERNYCDQLWRQNQKQKSVYQSMIKSIFDGLTEAIYDEFRHQSLFKIHRSRNCFLKGYPLFTNILMNSLTRVQSWSEYHCGMEIPVDKSDPNFNSYEQKKQERENLAVSAEVEQFLPQHYSSWLLWFQIMMGQIIFQELAEELGRQILGKEAH